MSDKWKELAAKVAKAAPLLGTALGGPVGGAVGGLVSIIAGAFGVSSDEAAKDPQKLIEAIGLDPDAAIKLKEIENNHKLEIEKILLEKFRLELQDLANARARETEIVKTTGAKDLNLYVLAWFFTLGFFASIGWMSWLLLSGRFPADIPQAAIMLFGMLIGCLTSGVSAVVQYFFGSSKSSSDKTKLLAGMKEALAVEK